jgi:hypothetical protein
MSSDGQFVQIGLADVYAIVQRIAEGNQRLDAKVDTALSIQTLRLEQLGERLQELKKAHEELEEKILESDRRLAELDKRPVVTPRAVLVAVTVGCTIIGTITSVVAILLK